MSLPAYRHSIYSPVQPCRLFSGALYEWCLDRLGPPNFFGVSVDNTFVIAKPDAFSLNPLNWWRLISHRTNIQTEKMRDLVYQVYLSKLDMKIYLGEYVYRDSYDFYDRSVIVQRGQWEWDHLDIDPYQSTCFEEIYNVVK